MIYVSTILLSDFDSFSVMDARKGDSASPEAGASDVMVDEASLITGKSQKQRGKQAKVGNESERRRPTRAEIQQREQEKTAQTASYFATLDEIHDDMQYGDADAVHTWLTIAGTLVDDFREAKELFPADRVRSSPFKRHLYTKYQQSTLRDQSQAGSKGLTVRKTQWHLV